MKITVTMLAAPQWNSQQGCRGLVGCHRANHALPIPILPQSAHNTIGLIIERPLPLDAAGSAVSVTMLRPTSTGMMLIAEFEEWRPINC
jgi:hypothetical protein